MSGAANNGVLIDSPSTLRFTFTGSGTTPYLAVDYEARLGSEAFYNVSSHAIDDQETLGVNAVNGNVISPEQPADLAVWAPGRPFGRPEPRADGAGLWRAAVRVDVEIDRRLLGRLSWLSANATQGLDTD